jgi:hypothetical protein
VREGTCPADMDVVSGPFGDSSGKGSRGWGFRAMARGDEGADPLVVVAGNGETCK